jgi:hypothetical protein
LGKVIQEWRDVTPPAGEKENVFMFLFVVY